MWELFRCRGSETAAGRPVLLDHELPASGRAKTYPEVFQHTMRLSAQLEKLGLHPASRNLAVCFDRTSFAAVVSLLAALYLNCPYVPVSSACPGLGEPVYRCAAILEMVDAWCILCGSSTLEFARSVWEAFQGIRIASRRVIDVDALSDVQEDEGSVTSLPHFVAEQQVVPAQGRQDILHIIFTSGSTGRPKGVCGLQSALLNRLDWQWMRFPWRAGEVACARTPLTFIDHAAEIFSSLLAVGGPVLVCPLSNSQSCALLTSIREFAVTRLVLTPTLLKILLLEAQNFKESPWKSLQILTCSGELLTRSLVAEARCQIPSDCRLLNIYGSTEVAGDATCAELPGDDVDDHHLLVPCGRAIEGVRIHLRMAKIADMEWVHLREKDPENGDVGEVYVSGRCLAAGYCGESPDAFGIEVGEAFPFFSGERCFRSNDLAKWQTASNRQPTLYVLGRCGQMVKVRGQRVELSLVEAALCSAELAKSLQVSGQLFSEAACMASEDQLLAVAVLAPGHTFEVTTSFLGTLRRHLAHLLPAASVPSHVTAVPALPKLPNGKVDRRSLSFRVGESTETATDLPSSHEEGSRESQVDGLVRNTWQSCLNLPAACQPDASASFFVAGGDSAGLMKLASQLRQGFVGSPPEFDDVMTAATKSYSALLQLCSLSMQRNTKRKCPEAHAESVAQGAQGVGQAALQSGAGIRKRTAPTSTADSWQGNCMCYTRGGTFTLESAMQVRSAALSLAWRGAALLEQAFYRL